MPSRSMIPYEIQVIGPLSERWDGRIFEGLSIKTQRGVVTTIEVRVPDTAALRGLINHLWDINLEIILLKQLQSENVLYELEENDAY